MRAGFVCCALLLFAATQACAESFAIPAINGEFSAPDGFSQLSKREIAQKYPYSNAPFFVLGNEKRTATIAVNLHDKGISHEHFDEAKTEFETLLDRMTPGIQWQKREIVELQRRRWILLEFTSNAIDTDIHNIMLITPRLGRTLIFNFNATREDFPGMEEALRASMETIKLP